MAIKYEKIVDTELVTIQNERLAELEREHYKTRLQLIELRTDRGHEAEELRSTLNRLERSILTLREAKP